MTFYEEEMEAVHGKCSARIRALETELADWQRMRNEAMAVATSNRARINELEALCAAKDKVIYEYDFGSAKETKGDENGK